QVKTFLNLQQQAAEVMAAVAIWELELNDVELELGNVNKNGKLCIKEQISPLYNSKGTSTVYSAGSISVPSFASPSTFLLIFLVFPGDQEPILG
ncbi:hypothetical protein G5I_02388, partial [Acromyrmex echinatior]